ncbi:MAG: transporter, family, multidrug resistance protein [Thermoproteota archaeon]|nr:transporter, family, multidrug resistance protein [Thermoproteota archaeon]
MRIAISYLIDLLVFLKRIISIRSTGDLISGLSKINVKHAALLMQMIISVSFNIMGSFFPLYIKEEFNYSLIDATYWTSVCQLVASSLMALTAPFWGFMCDRVGTKKILIMAIVGNAMAYAGMGFSTSVTHLILFRALQGSFGGISTVMFTLVASVVPAQELKQALSYQMAAMTLGSLCGPGVGGFLASAIGYKGTFMTSTLLFVSVTPLAYSLRTPKRTSEEKDTGSFKMADLKTIMPDALVLVLVYACVNFIVPQIPYFLSSTGISSEQLLTITAITTILNGAAFAVAAPLLTKVVSDKTLPILSAVAGGAIFLTAFVHDSYQFIALRIIIGAVQSGIPPSLLGGKSARKGTSMGFLNSARFIGIAIGPFLASSILRNGTQTEALYMFATMASISFIAAFFIYLTHTRKKLN